MIMLKFHQTLALAIGLVLVTGIQAVSTLGYQTVGECMRFQAKWGMGDTATSRILRHTSIMCRLIIGPTLCMRFLLRQHPPHIWVAGTQVFTMSNPFKSTHILK